MNKKTVTKEEMDDAIFYANMKEMKEEMAKCEMLKGVMNEDLRNEQEYLQEKGVGRARMGFRIRSKMVNKV